jgi:predicted PurR-regulated permease PerM
MRQIIKYALVVLGTICAAFLLYQFRGILVILLISMAVTAASRPLLEYLRKFRIPGFLAQLLVLVLLLAVIGGLLLLAGPTFLAEMQRLTNYSLIQYSTAYQVWESGQPWQQTIASRLPEPGSLVDTFLGANGELLLPAAFNLTQNLAAFLGNVFVFLTFTLYWAQDQDRFNHIWLALLPAHQRIPARNAWQAAQKAVGRYLRNEVALGILAAVLLGAGYAILGLPYPTALALLAFLGWIVPLVGFAIILIPVLITALGGGWGMVLLSVAFTLAILIGLKYWIEPKYFKTRRYSSFWIVLWIVVLGSLFGLGGFIAGPVVAVASQAVGSQYLQFHTRPERVEDQLAALKERYAVVYARYVEIKEQQPNPQLTSILQRLEQTLSQTERLENERIAENPTK